jgi:hypothetical protein
MNESSSSSSLASVTILTRQLRVGEQCDKTNMGFGKDVCVLPLLSFTNSIESFLAQRVSEIRARVAALSIPLHLNAEETQKMVR